MQYIMGMQSLQRFFQHLVFKWHPHRVMVLTAACVAHSLSLRVRCIAVLSGLWLRKWQGSTMTTWFPSLKLINFPVHFKLLQRESLLKISTKTKNKNPTKQRKNYLTPPPKMVNFFLQFLTTKALSDIRFSHIPDTVVWCPHSHHGHFLTWSQFSAFSWRYIAGGHSHAPASTVVHSTPLITLAMEWRLWPLLWPSQSCTSWSPASILSVLSHPSLVICTWDALSQSSLYSIGLSSFSS